MRVLALDAALDGCSAGLVIDGAVVAERYGAGGRGQSAILPVLARDVLTGMPAASLDQVAVTVGPGSFTGIRAALALAHGIGVGVGVPVVGVTVGAALVAGLPPLPGGWGLWVAIRSRRSRVFLEVGGRVLSLALDEVESPSGPVAVAGNAALDVAARLAARGCIVRLLDVRRPAPAAIARAALAAPGPAQPLYVDLPRTTAPA